jgi:hypothetical protein
MSNLPECWGAIEPKGNTRFSNIEPSLSEILEDPIVKLLMASDKVKRADLLSLLRRLRQAPPHAASPDKADCGDGVWQGKAAARMVERLRSPSQAQR